MLSTIERITVNFSICRASFGRCSHIRMPGTDGIETLRRLLAEDRGVPVILHSAYSSYKDNFLSWSASAYVEKSSSLVELKRTIKKLLRAIPGPTCWSGAPAAHVDRVEPTP